MLKSEEINELAKALALAQGAMEGAKKDALNPHFKSAYADLASVWAAIRKPLSDNGLSVIQLPELDDAGNVRMVTMLLHSSGQFIEASYALPATKPDAQGYGSAITYMKRYALSGMGVAPEDDDGESAVKQATGEAPKPNPKTLATQWAKEAEETIRGFKTLAELEDWHATNAKTIYRVRDQVEAAHKRLTDAIRVRASELSTLNA